MSETVKLIIEIPTDLYKHVQGIKAWFLEDSAFLTAIKNGIPLDDVKAEISQLPLVLLAGNYHIDKDSVMQILDNIGKGDKE